MTKNEDLAVHAYESWGFENINKDLISILNIWAKFLFSPLLENKVMKMQETNSTAYGAEAASKVHRELKKIGGVKPPREFVFMDRAAIGLGSVFLHLGAEQLYKIFNELISGFNEKEVEKKQNKLVEKTKLEKVFNFFSACSDSVNSLSSSAIVVAKSSDSSFSQVLNVNE